ncbi:uncharacterized protein LOC135689010 [Rhopilema esculentum]|uniref:uncharacterized protein LOC135689010 n=1 Tax=Rhopilema esculentum TaxID=499914 RepID=UPI0031D4A2F6
MSSLAKSSSLNGKKIIFDNVDYARKVHQMSETHQNMLHHWVTYMSTENRLPGHHLPAGKPIGSIDKVENAIYLPSKKDHIKQRLDYVYLVARLITRHIPCLQFLRTVVKEHMPHKFSHSTGLATKTVFHGCIYENENDSDGIQKVLKKLHTLVPVYEEDGEKKFGEQGIVGDQLSVERGVNCLLQVSNGFSSEDRFDGIHFEIGDFHAAMKFLQIGFDRFYTGASAADHCTLFADSVLINRRNVGSDVRSRYNPCKQFFLMEVEARLIAAVMELLKMTSIEDIPDKNILQEKLKTETLAKKREFLENLAATVVDSHIMQIDKVANYLASVNLPTKIEVQQYKGSDDDIYNYQIALLEFGMIVKNFFDAISEGDGDRLLRNWKFMLLYLKEDGRGSTKYALEAFYLISQANCLLSERAAFRMVWNRFSKTKHGWGGNIPLDLALEHLNRLLKNVLRMLGPNATNQKAVDRYCKALMTRKSLIDLWDKSSSFIKQSGKHTMSCADGDLRKIVKELIECHALRKIPKRRYQYFKRVKSSLIANLDMTSLFAWIEKHKKFIKERKAAR